MAFEGLTEKLSATFKKLRGKGRLKESDVKEAMREIRLALLEADVSYKVVKDFTTSVTERCIGADVLESLTPAQMIVKIVNEELTRLMGSETQHITINPKGPTVVMLVGLQGAGKTTNGSKLAGLMKRQGRNPLLVACDIYRPAAIRQLEVCGEKLGLPVFQMGQTNPVDIAKAAVQHAIRHGNDMVFLDTAGRLHIDETLMEELKAVKAASLTRLAVGGTNLPKPGEACDLPLLARLGSRALCYYIQFLTWGQPQKFCFGGGLWFGLQLLPVDLQLVWRSVS